MQNYQQLRSETSLREAKLSRDLPSERLALVEEAAASAVSRSGQSSEPNGSVSAVINAELARDLEASRHVCSDARKLEVSPNAKRFHTCVDNTRVHGVDKNVAVPHVVRQRSEARSDVKRTVFTQRISTHCVKTFSAAFDER